MIQSSLDVVADLTTIGKKRFNLVIAAYFFKELVNIGQLLVALSYYIAYDFDIFVVLSVDYAFLLSCFSPLFCQGVFHQ